MDSYHSVVRESIHGSCFTNPGNTGDNSGAYSRYISKYLTNSQKLHMIFKRRERERETLHFGQWFLNRSTWANKKKGKKEENRGKQRKEKVPVLSGIQTRDLLRSVTNIPIAPINTSLVHWHKLSIYWTAGLFYYHGRLHLTNGLKQTWYSGPFVIHFLSSVAHSHFDLLSQFLT